MTAFEARLSELIEEVGLEAVIFLLANAIYDDLDSVAERPGIRGKHRRGMERLAEHMMGRVVERRPSVLVLSAGVCCRKVKLSCKYLLTCLINFYSMRR